GRVLERGHAPFEVREPGGRRADGGAADRGLDLLDARHQVVKDLVHIGDLAFRLGGERRLGLAEALVGGLARRLEAPTRLVRSSTPEVVAAACDSIAATRVSRAATVAA